MLCSEEDVNAEMRCSCHRVANTIRSMETGPGEEVKRSVDDGLVYEVVK